MLNLLFFFVFFWGGGSQEKVLTHCPYPLSCILPYIIAFIYCHSFVVVPNFSLLSFIHIFSNVPSPNPLKCILLVLLLNRRRLLSISLTNETPICPYPLCYVSCQFPYPQFWPFPFVPCQLQTVLCPGPCFV